MKQAIQFAAALLWAAILALGASTAMGEDARDADQQPTEKQQAEEKFDAEAALDEVRKLLADEKYEAAERKLEELEKHAEGSRGLQQVHITAYSLLQQAGRIQAALRHLQAIVELEMAKAAEHGFTESFARYVELLASSAARTESTEQTLERLDALSEKAQGLDASSDEIKSIIDVQRALVLVRADKLDEAQSLLAEQLTAAEEALKDAPQDDAAILRMASILAGRIRLEEAYDEGTPEQAAEELLNFLQAEAEKESASVPVVQRYVSEHLSRASRLSRTDPDKADELLNRIEALVEAAQPSDDESEPTPRQAALSGLAGLHSPLASVRERIEQARKMLALVGTDAAYPENVDGWVGPELSPESLKGKVVLLDFFAVWCGPCIATFPHLREWHEEFADDGLQIIGVTNYQQYGWDDEAQRPKRERGIEPEAEREAMAKFVEHHQLEHPIAFTSDRELQEKYMVNGIPHAVVIDRRGKIKMFRIGSGDQNAKDLRSAIEEALSDTANEEAGGQ